MCAVFGSFVWCQGWILSFLSCAPALLVDFVLLCALLCSLGSFPFSKGLPAGFLVWVLWWSEIPSAFDYQGQTSFLLKDSFVGYNSFQPLKLVFFFFIVLKSQLLGYSIQFYMGFIFFLFSCFVLSASFSLCLWIVSLSCPLKMPFGFHLPGNLFSFLVWMLHVTCSAGTFLVLVLLFGYCLLS